MGGRNLEQTSKLFEKYKPTHVIHLAALGTVKRYISANAADCL